MERLTLKKICRDTNQGTPCQDPQMHLGEFPEPALLANPYVPYQKENSEQYSRRKGLIRGTLFPGLDLPYLGMVNTVEKGDSGLAELQALDFAMNELALYLDTHAEDTEAMELFQSYADLYRKGAAEYEKSHGPLKRMHAIQNGKYCWKKGPWPWEYAANLGEED